MLSEKPAGKWIPRIAPVALLALGLLLIGFLPEMTNSKTDQSEKTIFDFHTADQLETWLIVNDGVMGGLSQSAMELTSNRTALFRGEVSLENNGGFASVRTHPFDYQLDNYDGVILRVRGDGRMYKFRLRVNDYFDGIAYETTFQTQPNIWQMLRFPFAGFEPVFRGYPLTDAPPLDSAKIARLGFMISDKQAGPFELQIDWIKAFGHQ